MYQFYYANNVEEKRATYTRCVSDVFTVTAIRPTVWEEHCLECAAPLCFHNCLHYENRGDGRCKRFMNGISVRSDDKGANGQAARVIFRKWANMMTVVYPSIFLLEESIEVTKKNQRLGNLLKNIHRSYLPQSIRWQTIRTIEFIRRSYLRKKETIQNEPDAFIFHGFSFEEQSFHLIMEVFKDHTPLFRKSMEIYPGENFYILSKEELSPACWTPDNVVKIYPENDIEAEIDVLWCDFVQGTQKSIERAADKVKCVVWDLDNTVWDGILIESEEPTCIKLNPHVLDTIKELDRRGIIQSIASKNDYDFAWSVVEHLGISDYFLYPQISWNAKSESMRNIAICLNIGLDTLALVDDSLFEREQVKSSCPQVRVYDSVEIPELLLKEEFSVIVTQESMKRREMYRAEEKRNQLKSSGNIDTVTFLKKCNLAIEIFTPKTEEDITRCFELVIRTNQLNMTGKKYSRDEFEEALRREGHKIFAFKCSDIFGEYGIVGFGQYSLNGNRIIFSEFAMSCRVAGKYVESALFASLLASEQKEVGEFGVIKTKKNILLRNTLKAIGFSVQREDNTSVLYNFKTKLINDDLVKCEIVGDEL